MLNSVRANFVLHKKKYGQMVIATDSKQGYWRRDFFENYKIQRRLAKKLDQSGIDWPWVMEIVDEVISDLEKYFPFPVIRVPKAEGDDIIATLVELVATDPRFMGEEDMFGNTEPEDTLILSSDRDNFQLHKYKNVRQWSPRDKKLIKPDNYRQALIEKIIKGEAGASSDSIPNIRSQDDIFLIEARQKPISQARLDAFYVAKDLKDACIDEQELKNLIRNQTLVDYTYIPESLKSDIISVYNTQVAKKAPKMALMGYFTNNRMANLLGNITDFYL